MHCDQSYQPRISSLQRRDVFDSSESVPLSLYRFRSTFSGFPSIHADLADQQQWLQP